jgi:AraC family transcriptional regulator of arabinose operon
VIDLPDRALWPDEAQVGEVIYPPGGTHGPRFQPFVQLVLIHTGSMTVWIDGAPLFARAETVTILFPGHREQFAFAPDQPTHHTWLHAYFDSPSRVLIDRLRSLPAPLPLTAPMHRLMREALLLKAGTIATAEPMTRALAALMLWRCLGEGDQRRSDDPRAAHEAVERARLFIHDHLADPLTLEGIARAAAISESQLIRLFRAHLGTTPIAYLWDRRVRMGLELLQHSGLSIGVIADRCGFQTSYHFSRRVRQATGRSPRDLRRLV